MWKWLGGCLLLVIALVVGSLIWGIREMKKSLAPDGSVVVSIATTPARIFATLSHGDSAATWMAEGSPVVTSRHGPLVPGDTLRIEMPARVRVSRGPQQAITWRVKEVVPGQVMAFELLEPTRGVIALRRDSIAAAGDSTRVITKIWPLIDSLTAARQSEKAGSGMAFDFLLSILRMQAKLELMKLKMRIEGTAQRVRTTQPAR